MSDKNIFLPLVEKFTENDLESASRIFEALPEAEYPAESVGRIMTTDFLCFDKGELAHEAIEKNSD